MELDGPRPGRATANMAKVERKKRTTLENMVKMRVGWGFGSSKTKRQ